MKRFKFKFKFKSLTNAIMILLSASIIIAFPVPAPAQAQNTADNASASAGTDAGDIGSFDIDKVFEDVSGGGDTALASSAASAFPRQPENYALVMLRIVGYLAVITMVIVALAWAVRKFGVAGVSKVGGGNNMDVIETLYLGQNKGAALVRLGDTVYFLGHTSENIVLLEKIEGEKAIEFIASSKGGTSIMNFKDAFNNFLGKMKRS